MNIWLRITSALTVDSNEGEDGATEVSVKSVLNLTVYRTKERAETAQEQAGGIILEVDARGLREVENEFGEEVLIIREDKGMREGNASTSAAICLASIGELVPNYGPGEPGTVEPQGDIMEFSSDEAEWLDKFSELTGFSLHQ